jgi:hypothetical protein
MIILTIRARSVLLLLLPRSRSSRASCGIASWPPSHLRLPLPVLVKQRLIGWPKPTTSRVASEARCAQRRCLSPLGACRISFEMCVESPLKSSPPAAGPVQTVRPRVPPGCRPHRWAGAVHGVARQRPGCSGAGGGAACKGRVNFLSAPHVIARGIFRSVPDLARKLFRYIRHHNKHARPVKWAYRDPAHRITAAAGSSVTVQ